MLGAMRRGEKEEDDEEEEEEENNTYNAPDSYHRGGPQGPRGMEDQAWATQEYEVAVTGTQGQRNALWEERPGAEAKEKGCWTENGTLKGRGPFHCQCYHSWMLRPLPETCL